MFRVIWLSHALSALTDLWTSADSTARQAITNAVHRIDQALQANPYHDTESRADDSEERVHFVYPLGVLLHIDLRQRIVSVVHVWRYRRRGE